MDWIMVVLIGSLFILMVALVILVEVHCRRTIRIPKSQCPRYTYTKAPPLLYEETRWETPKKDDDQ